MALSTKFSILNTNHQPRETSMPFRSYSFKNSDTQRSSCRLPSYNHYAHLSERDHALVKLQQLLQLLQTETKSLLLTLAKRLPCILP